MLICSNILIKFNLIKNKDFIMLLIFISCSLGF